MSFSGSNDKMVNIIISIKIHVGQDMDSVHYYCGLLDKTQEHDVYMTMTEYLIIQGNEILYMINYRMKINKIRGKHIMKLPDRILLMLYIK